MFDLDDKEILRYMGCFGEVPSGLVEDISRLKGIFFGSVKPRHVCAAFPLEEVEGGVEVLGTGLILVGKDIGELLKDCRECYLLAATLGMETDRLIAYTLKKSVADGVIMDAIATTAIEAYCDHIQGEIGEKLTMRYSCGYGDLPLELQPKFLAALNAEKTIGLYCNEKNIMTPKKSVTAVMGVGKEGVGSNRCQGCSLGSSCLYRKVGKFCER